MQATLRRLGVLVVVLIPLAWGPVSRCQGQLTASELVLIVNRNEPQSRELAEFYARARQVPEGRILELDLPAGDRLERRAYEEQVVPAVRNFILEQGLRDQVRCAVTFYGVPLIIDEQKLSPTEQQELRSIAAEAAELAARMAPLVQEAEDIARRIGHEAPAWRQEERGRLDALLARLNAVEEAASARAGRLSEQERQALAQQIGQLRQRLDRPFEPDGQALDPAEVGALLRTFRDPASRQQLRQRLRASGTLRDYATLLERQRRLLSTEQSEASFDSELATLWIEDAWAAGWMTNPLAQPGNPAARGGRPVVLMVSRLDGRDPQQVRDLIATSVTVEQAGLEGNIVIDSRGLRPGGADGAPDGYGMFDEQLRQLAQYLGRESRLPVVHDDQPEVIAPPGVDEVAVYVGWYSLTKYVPAFSFQRGAVGYHIASFEMRSLRDPARPGWVRGLLDDGVVATFGPVNEPFLVGFPPPGDFIPLLLTGELTLAEVFWGTVPVMSWRVALIGDPLYRPFAGNPAVRPEALPPPLRLRLGR